MNTYKINMGNLFKKIKQNHWLMMGICCGIPLILLVVVVYFLGLNNKYLFWGILLLCPVLHYFIMKDMHKKHGDKDGKRIGEGGNKKEEENQKCH